MGPVRMVPLTSVPDAFTARVVAARLGSEGILWELRGNVGGPYPGGPVQVLVSEDDLTLASLLLVSQDAELDRPAELDDDGDEAWEPRPRGGRRWFAAVALLALLVLVLARTGLHLLWR